MRVLISDSLPGECAAILSSSGELEVTYKPGTAAPELEKLIGEFDSLIVRSGTRVTSAVLESGTSLRIVGRAGAGVDNIDVPAATRLGIVVLNTPGGNTVSVVEHTFALMLSLARHIPQASSSLKSGRWEKSAFMGTELNGKVLGVVGLGRIGKEVARRGLCFGMRVVAYDPLPGSVPKGLEEVSRTSFDRVLSGSDFLTIHVPFSKDTKHLVGAREISIMKKGSRLINCSRGGVVDESSLYDALCSGHLSGAALDVFEREPPVENPLLSLDNVVATPHLGASTHEAQLRVAISIAENVRDALLGKGIRDAVNIPPLAGLR